jgi:hypothetical protein
MDDVHVKLDEIMKISQKALEKAKSNNRAIKKIGSNVHEENKMCIPIKSLHVPANCIEELDSIVQCDKIVSFWL